MFDGILFLPNPIHSTQAAEHNMAKENLSQSPHQLTEMQRYVTQERGTEPPFSGRLLHNRQEGIYHCLCCNSPLFYSDSKYDSGCGWPSFFRPYSADAIRCLMMIRTICIASKFAARSAMRIWDICFPTAPNPAASAIA